MTDFIKLAFGERPYNIQDPLFYNSLIFDTDGERPDLLEFVLSDIVCVFESIKHRTIFDFFYDRALRSDKASGWWLSAFNHILVNLKSRKQYGQKYGSYKFDKRYISELQGSNRNHNDMFKILIEEGFSMPDRTQLIYTLVSRDELEKLQILNLREEVSTIKRDYPAIFAYALRFGRCRIINYLLEIGLDHTCFGKIFDLEGYVETPDNLYANVTKSLLCPSLNVFGFSRPVDGSCQNYRVAFSLLSRYLHKIDGDTLFMWFYLHRYYEWDRCDFGEIWSILKPRMTRNIPIHYDYGSYNELIFGEKWGTRAGLIQQILALERRL